jgi:hypothetical protein
MSVLNLLSALVVLPKNIGVAIGAFMDESCAQIPKD